MTPPTQKSLLLSIHDVGPKFERQIEQLASLYDSLVGLHRYAMLVVPNHWGEAPLKSAPGFQAKLRAWADAGVDMFVHGWFHRDDSHHSAVAGFKARHMTAGEGEFLGLDEVTARQRMVDGRALVEDVIGRPVAGFIAPAWLYGPGSRAALNTLDFKIAEDHLRVWRPGRNEMRLATGPVITWASRSRWRTASSLFFAAIARQALQPAHTVRIAVHPGDTSKAEILLSIRKTVTELLHNRTPARYSDLV